MKRWNVVSMLAGVGMGAAAVAMIQNKNGNGKMRRMATDFLKSETR